MLFKSCGRGVVFGARLTLRHPHKIELGAGTVLDDNVVLDAKGTDNEGIRIGQGAFIGRDTILSCKNGDIILGDRVNLGFRCEIFSGSRVELADSVLVAAYTYLVGGGHPADRLDVPVLEQGHFSRGIHVETGVWLGAGVIVLDGLRIGAHAIIGAGAVVSRDVPAYHIAAGVPARLVRDRRADQDPGTP
ncbi:MAG: acyltransferase [Candidatus Marinimicrobia bacterium]|nr:acyltransferase [Candidatus Neomarinimicrobiota bacterium]